MSGSLTVKFTNNHNAVFYPNQVVAGSVELRVDSAIKARGLRLIVKGKAECKWSESTGSGNDRRTTTYTGKEKYIESVTYLFGSANGDTIAVPVGVHTYNFECRLPEAVPYSVEGTKGSIKYKVDANLDIPWGFDMESVKPFTVVRHDDLNQVRFPDFRSPVEVEKIKTFCCLFCESDPLFLTMRVPRTGFGLGEKIPIYVQMVNKSTTNVYSTEFLLKKVEQFHSSSPSSKSKIYKSVVTSKTNRGVHAGETVSINELLEIPQILSTSNDRFCKVFQIKYYLKFKAHTDGSINSPNMDIFITIGNSGIVDVTATAPPIPLQLISMHPAAPDVETPSAPNDLPPSFEEATRNQIPTFEEALNNQH